MKKIIFIISLTAAVLFSLAPVATARAKTDVYIGITSVGDKHLPAIGLPAFNYESTQSQDAANLIHEVMRADLLFARYFDINEDGPEFNAKKLSQTLTSWAKAKASYLLAGEVTYAEPHYTIKIYVYDLSTRTAVFSKAFKGTQ
ncbi:MAG: hypothetical protein IKO35_04640, partial [Elusimicrobiaceae bacterium]|nr:hypothetical protein [Elusimicrobiaceae bacterium]